MGSGIFFPICALPIIIMIIISFNIKKHVKNDETRLYNILIVTNFVGLIIEILCSFFCKNYSLLPFASSFVLKSYLVYLIIWTAIFTIYIYRITVDKKNKVIRYAHLLFLALSVVTIYLLPITPVILEDGKIFYTEGLSVSFSYLLSFVYVLVILGILSFNFKKIKSKKYLPVFLFLAIGTVAIIIQKTNPGLLLLTYSETLICFSMYFTIENPDIKMVKEIAIEKDRADKANNAKTDFLSSMSHEIRTPLNAIVGFSNGLLDNDLSDTMKDDVNNIITSSNNLLELVNGILDISKIESGKLEIIRTEYELKKIFDELVTLSKSRIGEKPIEFRYYYDETIPKYLYGDGQRLKQIMLNFLTNAIKYTKSGFIEFKINHIKVNDNVQLIISVEDSGIGVKKENIQKLFNKFERLEVEKNTTVEGTGLGLAITKKLVELMGGKIYVTSELGKGSKFFVSVVNSIVSKEKAIDLDKKNTYIKNDDVIDIDNLSSVLVVDDNSLNLKVADRLLKKYGINARLVESGFEALENIKTIKYDLILMDDMMPKMSGSETLVKLKENPSFNTPVVVLTANAIEGMKEEYLDKGFDDYLAKPIERNELERILRKYLHK